MAAWTFFEFLTFLEGWPLVVVFIAAVSFPQLLFYFVAYWELTAHLARSKNAHD